MQRKSTRGTTVAVVACAFLAACQNNSRPVVSVADARKIQAEFAGQTDFVPPPRTIADVTAILRQYEPDPARLDEARKKANAEPSPILTAGDRATFMYERAQAAGELGRYAQQLADATEAVRLGSESKSPSYGRFAQLLRVVLNSVGNQQAALAISRERFAAAAPNSVSQLVGLGIYAANLIRVGNLDEGRKTLERADALFAQIGGRIGTNILGVKAGITNSKAALASAQGHLEDAERYSREALAEFIQYYGPSDSLMVKSGQGEFDRQDQGTYLRTTARFGLVRVLTSEGKLVEAELEARKILIERLKYYGRYAPQSASGIIGLARVIYEQGRYAEASTLTDIAIDAYRSIGVGAGSVTFAVALVLKGKIQTVNGDVVEALASFNEARNLLAADDMLRVVFVDSDPSIGAAMLAAGDARSAAAFFEKLAARNQSLFGVSNYLTAEAQGYLGAALAKNGSRDRALSEFAAAIPILIQASRQSDNDEMSVVDRDRRLRQILEAYIDLLSQYRPGERVGLDPAVESFRIADAVRARSVQRALADSAARSNIRDPDLAALVRQEQDARKQIAALFGLLYNILMGPPDQQDVAATQQLRAQIDTLRGARTALRSEIERRFPNYVNLIDPQPATVAEVQALLNSGEALLSIYVAANKTYVWAVPKHGRVVFASADLDEKAAALKVDHLRKALDPDVTTLGAIPAFDIVAAYRLYNQLIEPVSAGLVEARSLLVVPDKALGQLPFGLLVTQPPQPVADGTGALFSGYKRVPFLIRQMAVTQSPTVAALVTLRRMPAANFSRKAFAGFGDPWFSQDQAREARNETATQVALPAPAGVQTRSIVLKRRSAPTVDKVDSAELGMLPRLPDTADEVRSVAVALKADPSKDVFLGAAANVSQVKTLDLANRKVVMFATHGLIPGDLNGLSQPALALSAPAVAHTDGNGLLTMDEILGLRLDADWIVLSACNTAAGAGAEAASGLGLAFFYAGTRAVLLTNWPVETTSARALTTDLFRRQAEDATLGRAVAMQKTMIAMIDGDGYVGQGKTLFSYAHPIFWAPFSLIGDGA